jgi:peptidoglycan/LPS O-acetylase OafA/YrhL
MRQSFAPLATGHENNLNLMRLIAALCVLVSHAWPIALGPQAVEPFEATTGFRLGALSVFTFFAISGFLMTASLERSSGLWSYFRARIARIYPGLIVSIALVTFILGPVFTQVSLPEYFGSAKTWQAFLGNASLLKLEYQLPGVFTSNPYQSVQGSLWTLPVEMSLYIVVALLGMLGLFRRPLLLVLACGFGLFAISQSGDANFSGAHALRSLWYPGLPFFFGMGLYLARKRLPSSPVIAAALIVLAGLSMSGPLGYLTMALAISYATLWLAGMEAGALRGWNRMGNYSYGMYVYAFPVQGMVVAIEGDMDPIVNIALAAPITLALAVLSWHLVERPAMRAIRKRRISAPISSSNAS